MTASPTETIDDDRNSVGDDEFFALALCVRAATGVPIEGDRRREPAGAVAAPR